MPVEKDDMRILKRFLPLFAAVMVLSGLLQAGRPADAESMDPVTPEPFATVTFVRGAPVLTGGTSSPEPLTEGQGLYAGSGVETDDASRVEMVLSGGGIVRLGEKTAIELGGETKDADGAGSWQQLMLLDGDMWANFSDRHRDSAPQILAVGALISGPRCIFRTVMPGGGGLEVKAYTGPVTASGPFEVRKEDNSYLLAANPGNEENPLEQWRYQITPYQKMIVLASGEASKPFRFAAKSDLTEWVHWNQERDKALE
jgi:hypothetical protein